jgi:hypothetical protein
VKKFFESPAQCFMNAVFGLSKNEIYKFRSDDFVTNELRRMNDLDRYAAQFTYGNKQAMYLYTTPTGERDPNVLSNLKKLAAQEIDSNYQVRARPSPPRLG